MRVAGLYEVQKLIESKRRRRPDYPCPVCNEWQDIDCLLRNAPAARPAPLEELLAEFATVRLELAGARQQLITLRGEAMGRFDKLDIGTQRILSRVDDAFTGLMQSLIDEAKEGPRLFSFKPLDPGFFDRPKWINQKFRLTLWCEHSRLPLPELNGNGNTAGVYELNLPREWFVKAAPFLKVLTGTLSLVLPVAASATKFVMDETAYKGLEKELDLGQKSLDSVLKGGEQLGGWLGRSDAPDLERGEAIRAQGAVLRQLHAWLKEKDPSFGGLVRVQNKRQEFLWLHPQFENSRRSIEREALQLRLSGELKWFAEEELRQNRERSSIVKNRSVVQRRNELRSPSSARRSHSEYGTYPRYCAGPGVMLVLTQQQPQGHS
jgi:internalin A